ncbi:MAG TPA: STAS/SEC14 domain-containing protein [Burkholderiales bacterium]|nr:STAS/SEC14 domain-containing protein [Burkholderiales bacterium]
MITIVPEPQLITVTAFAEFTLADYKEFEAAALAALAAHQKPNLLFDLSEMVGYTVDVAWEEIQFSRQHAQDFLKVAVVTTDQWMIWSAWLSQLFVESDIEVFEDVDSALAWLNEELV